MNTLKEKLKSGKVLGTLVCLSDPSICEMVGNVGYDCVWIDMEHTYLSYKEVLCHLNAAKASGVSAVVRLPQNDLTATKKVLEMGPDGIIFPMVRSAKEAKELIENTLYPPLGTRGFGPMRAIGYNAAASKQYAESGSLSLCRLMQIEHISMINELEQIADNPYIDGFIFGPNDLSGSVGAFLDVFGEKTVAEIKRAIAISRQKGKFIGVACGSDEATLAFWNSFDFDMVFAGADWNFIYSQASSVLETMKKMKKTT